MPTLLRSFTLFVSLLYKQCFAGTHEQFGDILRANLFIINAIRTLLEKKQIKSINTFYNILFLVKTSYGKGQSLSSNSNILLQEYRESTVSPRDVNNKC